MSWAQKKLYIIFFIFLFDPPKINFEPPRSFYLFIYFSLTEMNLNMIILTISYLGLFKHTHTHTKKKKNQFNLKYERKIVSLTTIV